MELGMVELVVLVLLSEIAVKTNKLLKRASKPKLTDDRPSLVRTNLPLWGVAIVVDMGLLKTFQFGVILLTQSATSRLQFVK